MQGNNPSSLEPLPPATIEFVHLRSVDPLALRLPDGGNAIYEYPFAFRMNWWLGHVVDGHFLATEDHCWATILGAELAGRIGPKPDRQLSGRHGEKAVIQLPTHLGRCDLQ